MILSMTGFGKSVAEIEGKKLNIEIRTLNSKQLDLNIRMCRLLKDKEVDIRSIVTRELQRGKVDVAIYFDNKEDATNISINKALLEKYFNELKSISAEIKNDFPTDYFSLASRMPDVLATGDEILADEHWHNLLKSFDDALKQVNTFRKEEGKILGNDIKQRVNLILKHLESIAPFEKERIEIIKTRLHKDLEEFVNKENIDANRFEQELIYYIDKIDITEEKIRLQKHCNYFIDTMKQPEANGRKLGFITQEMGREINTIGSKANDADIQKIVVQMKDELEKIKEQLLNIL
ncbi:MAG TPA: YicC family protein [Bacteroidales bacterium]|nr:YicC family protein [Bacteroidales bacterium]HPS16200.1 YicC family protein [Bacteroidales bacterium]